MQPILSDIRYTSQHAHRRLFLGFSVKIGDLECNVTFMRILVKPMSCWPVAERSWLTRMNDPTIVEERSSGCDLVYEGFDRLLGCSLFFVKNGLKVGSNGLQH